MWERRCDGGNGGKTGRFRVLADLDAMPRVMLDVESVLDSFEPEDTIRTCCVKITVASYRTMGVSSVFSQNDASHRQSSSQLWQRNFDEVVPCMAVKSDGEPCHMKGHIQDELGDKLDEETDATCSDSNIQ